MTAAFLPEQDFVDDPVSGDGVVTFPPDQENETMTQVDLSPNVANTLLTESMGNIQSSNQRSRDTADLATGSLQAGIAKTHNELGPVESRAVSGVIATPVAAPSTGG